MFPFFALPPEIRDQIYQCVLGGQLIHVMHEANPNPGFLGFSPGLFYSICSAEETENSVFARFKAGQEDGLDCNSRHGKCYISRLATRRLTCELDLRLLRVCKQIYGEARLIPYEHNTFSISKAAVFEKFIHSLRPHQLQSFRALHLDVLLVSRRDAREWSRVIEMATTAHDEQKNWEGLGLRTLHLCLNQQFAEEPYHLPWTDPDPEPSVAGFLQLRRCPLKDVTVVMASWPDPGYQKKLDSVNQCAGFIRTMKVFKLTKAEKRDYCESVRRRLLGRAQEAPKTMDDPSDRI